MQRQNTDDLGARVLREKGYFPMTDLDNKAHNVADYLQEGDFIELINERNETSQYIITHVGQSQEEHLVARRESGDDIGTLVCLDIYLPSSNHKGWRILSEEERKIA